MKVAYPLKTFVTNTQYIVKQMNIALFEHLKIMYAAFGFVMLSLLPFSPSPQNKH
jgi:hydroxyacyl-ACP dehydratase HTD2-like protein with hotdog domain